ncbi:MAG: PIN domain-containing protein [Pseudomonadota bacterium]|nr:PIN domain-containing protein [Pseudomonadota bacterium]
MIGIDTNVVIRLLARDDPVQFDAATRLAKSARDSDPLVINPVVIAESIWVLEKRYGLEPKRSRPLMARFVSSVEFTVMDRMRCEHWFDWFQSMHRNFSDVLIAAINIEYGCSHTVTFDRRAAKAVRGMELLA